MGNEAGELYACWREFAGCRAGRGNTDRAQQTPDKEETKYLGRPGLLDFPRENSREEGAAQGA